MKKALAFLAVLAGTLSVATCGSFVSKDKFDDAIDELTTEIEELSEPITVTIITPDDEECTGIDDKDGLVDIKCVNDSRYHLASASKPALECATNINIDPSSPDWLTWHDHGEGCHTHDPDLHDEPDLEPEVEFHGTPVTGATECDIKLDSPGWTVWHNHGSGCHRHTPGLHPHPTPNKPNPITNPEPIPDKESTTDDSTPTTDNTPTEFHGTPVTGATECDIKLDSPGWTVWHNHGSGCHRHTPGLHPHSEVTNTPTVEEPTTPPTPTTPPVVVLDPVEEPTEFHGTPVTGATECDIKLDSPGWTVWHNHGSGCHRHTQGLHPHNVPKPKPVKPPVVPDPVDPPTVVVPDPIDPPVIPDPVEEPDPEPIVLPPPDKSVCDPFYNKKVGTPKVVGGPCGCAFRAWQNRYILMIYRYSNGELVCSV